eukprot:SAG31_NODE_2986_length_4818_cov_2.020555_2_plen_166_part_00
MRAPLPPSAQRPVRRKRDPTARLPTLREGDLPEHLDAGTHSQNHAPSMPTLSEGAEEDSESSPSKAPGGKGTDTGKGHGNGSGGKGGKGGNGNVQGKGNHNNRGNNREGIETARSEIDPDTTQRILRELYNRLQCAGYAGDGRLLHFTESTCLIFRWSSAGPPKN